MSNTEGIKPYSDLAHEAKECGGPDKLKEAWAEKFKEIGKSEQKAKDLISTLGFSACTFLIGVAIPIGIDKYNEYQHKKQIKLKKEADSIEKEYNRIPKDNTKMIDE